MDLAQHFDMNYDQILRKRTNKGQKKNFLNSVRNLVMHFYKVLKKCMTKLFPPFNLAHILASMK